MPLSERDIKSINGGFDELKAKVIKVETKLDAHQSAFEKHELRDETRFHNINNEMKDYRQENTQQHEQITAKVDDVVRKITWIIAVAVGAWTVIQLIVSTGIQISFGN